MRPAAYASLSFSTLAALSIGVAGVAPGSEATQSFRRFSSYAPLGIRPAAYASFNRATLAVMLRDGGGGEGAGGPSTTGAGGTEGTSGSIPIFRRLSSNTAREIRPEVNAPVRRSTLATSSATA